MIREESNSQFGFWVYLMTDCVLFASLFATFAVLHNSTFGGPGGTQLFSMPLVLAETLILLSSSFSCGLAVVAGRNNNQWLALRLLGITFILGLIFLGLEINEFQKLFAEGNSWRRSGFLSAFFTLVGTHGLHISGGLIWMGTLMISIKKHGLNEFNNRRLVLLSMFWHFLDIVWIFIFTVVYLMGSF